MRTQTPNNDTNLFGLFTIQLAYCTPIVINNHFTSCMLHIKYRVQYHFQSNGLKLVITQNNR